MYTASCLCGTCTIEFSNNIIGTGLCHCISCRKMTSSLFSINTIVPTSAFHSISGSPKTRQHRSDSGDMSTMNLCGDCGSLLWMAYSPRPDWKVLKSGIIDGAEDLMSLDTLKPKVEQFTARRPAWLCPVADAVQEPGQQAIRKADEMIEELQSRN